MSKTSKFNSNEKQIKIEFELNINSKQIETPSNNKTNNISGKVVYIDTRADIYKQILNRKMEQFKNQLSTYKFSK